MKTRKSLNRAVIEIEEVEYLIDEKAEKDILEGKEFIKLMRLFDGQEGTVSLKDLKKILDKNIVDYLD